MAPKGKQGTKGQKQIYEENKETLQFYFYMISGVNLVYSLILWYLKGTELPSLDIYTFVLSSILYAAAYFLMKRMAKASFNAAGAVIDGGIDLNMESGMGEYCKDVIIFTGIIQLLSLFSVYFWFGLLIIPLLVAIKVWNNIIAPWIFAPAPEDSEPTKKNKKKQKAYVVKR